MGTRRRRLAHTRRSHTPTPATDEAATQYTHLASTSTEGARPVCSGGVRRRPISIVVSCWACLLLLLWAGGANATTSRRRRRNNDARQRQIIISR